MLLLQNIALNFLTWASAGYFSLDILGFFFIFS